MDSETEISVVICTQNRAGYLDECFRSVASQYCSTPFEVVIVDNASRDNSAEVIRAWCKKDLRFRALHESRIGQSIAKNLGVKLARGRLILFTDDDVILDPNWMRAYCEFFSKNGRELVVAGGPVVPTPHDLGHWPSWFDREAITDVGMLDYGQERTLRRWEYVWGNNMAMPKAVFERFGLWDETLGHKGEKRGTFEDIEFQDRVKKEGVPVWFCPSAVVQHRLIREKITPRRVLSTAFARGRNEFWQESLGRWGRVDAFPKRNLLKCLTVLAGCLYLWALCAVGFRISLRRGMFELARRKAWACGWWWGTLDVGTFSIIPYRIMSRVIFRLRTFVLWLSPDNS